MGEFRDRMAMTPEEQFAYRYGDALALDTARGAVAELESGLAAAQARVAELEAAVRDALNELTAHGYDHPLPELAALVRRLSAALTPESPR